MLLGLLLVQMGIAATVSSKLISFFIIVISKVHLLVVFHVAKWRFEVSLVWQRGLRGLLAAHSIVLLGGRDASYLFTLA